MFPGRASTLHLKYEMAMPQAEPVLTSTRRATSVFLTRGSAAMAR
jgi:hypothetical protein